MIKGMLVDNIFTAFLCHCIFMYMFFLPKNFFLPFAELRSAGDIDRIKSGTAGMKKKT